MPPGSAYDRVLKTSSGTEETYRVVNPPFPVLRLGWTYQIPTYGNKIQAEINTRVSHRLRRPDSDPLSSDKNQLEVNKIECSLHDK